MISLIDIPSDIAYFYTSNNLKINIMKAILSIFGLSLLLVGCQMQTDNSARDLFEKNSQTVLSELDAFQNESFNNSIYAKDFTMLNTGFGKKGSIGVDALKKRNAEMWKMYDFKLLTDPLVLLPGVDSETKLLDGSVRYYGEWEVTRTATDSTEAKSATVLLYESFDFNEQGKLQMQQYYGNTSALIMFLQ